MQRQTSTNQHDASGQDTSSSLGHLSSYLLGGWHLVVVCSNMETTSVKAYEMVISRGLLMLQKEMSQADALA
jgi:hypothetical protein